MRTVADLMTKYVPTLRADDYLTRAVDQLLSIGFTGLPVVDEQRRLVGFLSEQDCIRTLARSSYHCESWVRINDIMSREPLFVSPDLSEVEIATLFGKAKPKVYPVVDEQRRVLGVITRSRVMEALNQQLKTCRVA